MDWMALIEFLRNARDVEIMNARREEIAAFLPKIRIMFGFDQKHTAHPYDLWMHTLHVVAELPRGVEDDMLYLGALLHDIGKPSTQCAGHGQDANMRYPEHPSVSARIVRDEVVPELEKKGVHLSDVEKKRLLYYVEHHDDMVDFDVTYLKRQKEFGAENFKMFQNLMYLEVADALAHAQLPFVVRRVEVCGALAGERGEKLWEGME